jgi:DNA-binding NtrC family response regulator
LEIKGTSDEAMGYLQRFSWPGNIRELRNVIEHAFIIETSEDYIQTSSLPESVLEGRKIEKVEKENFEIDFERIQNSVLDTNISDNQGYSFSFAHHESDGEIKMDFSEAKDVFEKEFLIMALRLYKGKINQTALKANIPKKTLLRKIEKYGIVAKDFS